MNKIAIVLFLSSFFIQAQTINKFDSNKKRHGIWKKNYKSGKIRYQGQFNHGKEIGTFKFYSRVSSEHPVIIKEFNKTDNTAKVSFYTVDGIKESTGFMQGKNRIGKWIYYHKGGKTIMQVENYVNGLLHGSYKTFYPNGKLTIETTYKNGKLDGVYKKYSIKNKLIELLTYKNGILNGPAELYDRNTGLIYEKGNYVDDIKLGEWSYYIDGKFTHTKEIKKSKYNK